MNKSAIAPLPEAAWLGQRASSRTLTSQGGRDDVSDEYTYRQPDHTARRHQPIYHYVVVIRALVWKHFDPEAPEGDCYPNPSDQKPNHHSAIAKVFHKAQQRG